MEEPQPQTDQPKLQTERMETELQSKAHATPLAELHVQTQLEAQEDGDQELHALSRHLQTPAIASRSTEGQPASSKEASDSHAVVGAQEAALYDSAPDSCADSGLAHQLRSESADIRAAAVFEVGFRASRGDAAMVVQVIGSLRDDAAIVRCHAAFALGRIAPCGDAAALEALLAALADADDPHIRNNAVTSLRKLATPGNARVTAALCACAAKDPNASVRLGAARALGDVAERGHHQTVAALVPSRDDPDPDVREAAMLSLGRIATPREPEAIATLLSLLIQNTPHRGVALKALSYVYRGGQQNHGRTSFSRFVKELEDRERLLARLEAENMERT